MLYYFYNNTSNFNFIDNNFFWRNCFINRVFLNLEELLFRSCIINNCDNFRFCIITTRCITKPTIVQFFTHELFVRASFLLSIDFLHVNRNEGHAQKHKQRVKIVKSETQRNLLEIKVMVPFSIIIATLNVCNATIEYRKFSYFVVDLRLFQKIKKNNC